MTTSYPIPPDESERVRLLQKLRLLDSPQEAVFDRITRLAARSLQVPIALISLIDSERQWFKSRVGLNATETPREYAFCAHAIAQDTPLIVADANEDERFKDNPLVTGDPNIRFYAGAQVRASGGVALGTLCAIDQIPRELTPEEIDTLQDLADLVSKEIQLREALVLSESYLQQSWKSQELSEALFYSVFEKASVGIALVAPNGRWLEVNDELCNIVGYSREELVTLTFQDITYPEDLNADLKHLHQLVDGQIDRYQMDKRYIRKNGEIVWINLNVTKVVNAQGELEYFVSIIKDIQAMKEAEQALASLHKELEKRVEERTTELRKTNEMLSFAMTQQVRSEQALSRREQELRMIIENANDAYISMDESGLVTGWNHQAELTFGWKREETIGKRLEQLIIPQAMREMHRTGMKRYLETGHAKVFGQRIEMPAICKNGENIQVELRISALKVNDNTIFSAFLHDITERKAIEAQREYEARYDSLTGLPNRRVFNEMLPAAIARADRGGKPLAILFLDLDGFKQVNDQMGHDAGDTLLREVAQRLQASVRQTDTVARIAGDEFIVLLENLSHNGQDSQHTAEKILKQLSIPFKLEGEQVTIGTSIGIACYIPDSGHSPDTLVKAADQAMYESKRAGKGRISYASDI